MSKRKYYYDYLRVFAMLSVVVSHVCSFAPQAFPGNSRSWERILYYCVRNGTRYAVPVFFMLSGAPPLNPKKQMDINAIYRKYVWKYVAVTAVFGFLFAYIESVYNKQSYGIAAMKESFLRMLSGSSWKHLWYLYVLVGAMLFLPVLRLITCHFSKRELRTLILTASLFLCVIPWLEGLTGKTIGFRYPIASIYVIYMLLGYYVAAYSVPIPPIIFLICNAWILIASYANMVHGTEIGYVLHYASPPVFGMALSLFQTVQWIHETKPGFFRENRMIQALSKASFGIYIIHPFWIKVLYQCLKWNPFSIQPVAGAILAWILVLLLSYGSVWVWEHLRYIFRKRSRS